MFLYGKTKPFSETEKIPLFPTSSERMNWDGLREIEIEVDSTDKDDIQKEVKRYLKERNLDETLVLTPNS
jgi:hypothetical protein